MFTLWYLWTLYNGRYKKAYDDELFQWIEESVDKLSDPIYHSLLKRCLSKGNYNRLKERQTVNGVTLKDVIYSGIENPTCGIGVYAFDPDAYFVFREVFDPIIEIYHSGFKSYHKTPKQDYGNMDKIFDLDPAGHYISAIRIRGNRCLDGFLFSPKMSKCDFVEVERKVSSVLRELKDDLGGYYYSLSTATDEVLCRLKFEKFLFENNNKILRDANCYNFWPCGRGVFFNMKHTLLVWINEEDHIRLVSMQKGGDLRSVYERYIAIMRLLEKSFSFIYDDRLGYLNFSIMNLGIAMRLTVEITLPCLSETPETKEKLQQFCRSKNLCNKELEDCENTYEIFTRKTLGLTEFQCVEQFQSAIFDLIRMERHCSCMSPEEREIFLGKKGPCSKPLEKETSSRKMSSSKVESSSTGKKMSKTASKSSVKEEGLKSSSRRSSSMKVTESGGTQ